MGLSAMAIFLHVATIVVTGVAVRTTTRPVPPPNGAPAVTLLRPACGIENNIVATLESSFRLDYPDYEVVFCVAREDDPVIPVIRALMADHEDIPARLLIGDERISINPKLNNLVKGWAAARHDWVVMTDSNVLLPADYIQYLESYWDAETGLVCSPAIGGAPGNLWGELECAFLNEHEARWQISADMIGRGFAQGKTMLWRKEVLNHVNGIAALASEPAEDAASTKVVRQAGLKVRLMPGPFIQPLGRRSFADLWGRQVRWARLRRTSFPQLYTPELLTGGFVPLASIALLGALGWLSWVAVAAIIIAWYGLEIALAGIAGWHVSVRTPLVLIARDLLLPALWLAGWTGNRVEWRGNAMDLGEASAGGKPPALSKHHGGTGMTTLRRRAAIAYRRWRRRGVDLLRGAHR
ncbi:MAG: ceramide glucosyltransferase [Alphaproteobacteria bacterium]